MIQGLGKESTSLNNHNISQRSWNTPGYRVDKEAKAVVESRIWAERREEDLLPNRQRRN